ncbi:MAG: YnfA family protein [Alphaproteobacteria bacterium]|nr:MAG: YnfA family protein [Alphaproteobacteria bacterium]
MDETRTGFLAVVGKGLGLFMLAALAEIGGCYAFWLALRAGRSLWWLMVGSLSLIFFGWLLTRSPTAFAGRAFAAYGGVYILAALVWLRTIEGAGLRVTDFIGAALTLLGAAVILMPRG